MDLNDVVGLRDSQSPEAVEPRGGSHPGYVGYLAPLEKAPRRRNEWLVRLLLAQADIAAILAAYFVADDVIPHRAGVSSTTVALLISLPLWVGALQALGLYQRDNDVVGHSTIDELPTLMLTATVGSWIFVLCCAATGHRPLRVIELFWLLLVVLLPTFRALVRPVFRTGRNYAQNTVIVGAGFVGQLLGRKLLEHPEYALNLVGFVDERPKERREDLDSLAVLGLPDDLPELIEENAIERVIVAFSNESHTETLHLIRLLKDLDVRIDIVPRLFEIIPSGLMSYSVAGIPLISLPRFTLSTQSRMLKRAFDLVVGLIATAALAPLFVLVSVLIKLDSPGPIIFRQKRIGEGGAPFVIFKFRTMTSNADEQKQQVAHLNAHANRGGDPRMFKVVDDPRVTRVGHLLRRFSLDEFPQLFNVLRGDMSLVGPRPLILEEDAHVEHWARRRLTLKPGMTGLWQVSGRNLLPFEEMVMLDYLYVTTWSLARDLQLIFKTVTLVFRGERKGHW